MKNALVVFGGWDGHEPELVSQIFKTQLDDLNFSTTLSPTLDVFLDMEFLQSLDLIVPIWTMGKITPEQSANVTKAVASGVGLAGCHGGMCDSFREDVAWQFMTGGQWVAHPGDDNTPYTVNITSVSNPLTEGLNDFTVCTEQYYVHIDPAVEVLASSLFPNPAARGFHSSNPITSVPVVWTKRWGHGRVFYNALGHVAKVFNQPEPLELMRRGFIWAAAGKKIAQDQGLHVDDFSPTTKA